MQREGQWPEKGTADLGPSGLEGDTDKRRLGTAVVRGGPQVLSGYLTFLKTCWCTASLAVISWG